MDDTLYDEYNYVRSGFAAVAKYLAPILNEDEVILKQWMWTRLKTNERGEIFDDLLKQYENYTKTLVGKCVRIYRTHKPTISLPQDTIKTLKELQRYPLYVVTDGNKIAQYEKVKALGLEKIMKHCYITHRYGKKHAKPSPYCFLHIQRHEQVLSENIVYIGDNPKKDFVGIKPLGFRTIRVLTGEYKNVRMPEEYEAEYNITSLRELPVALRTIWPDIKIGSE